MTATPERARFCNSCSAVIGWYATFCEECGMKASGEPAEAVRSQAVDSTPAQKDLFRAHMRVIHRHKEQLSDLQKKQRRIGQRVQRLDRQPDGGTSGELVDLSDEVVQLEQDWEDIQRSYNRQSENIEEDFLQRIDELEADLELAPDQQYAIEQEIRAFVEGLEKSEEEIRETARLLDILRAKGRRGGVALPGGGIRAAVLGLLALALLACGAVAGVQAGWVDAARGAAIVAPGAAALLGTYILILLRRL